jgi:hypothetical protein
LHPALPLTPSSLENTAVSFVPSRTDFPPRVVRLQLGPTSDTVAALGPVGVIPSPDEQPTRPSTVIRTPARHFQLAIVPTLSKQKANRASTVVETGAGVQ